MNSKDCLQGIGYLCATAIAISMQFTDGITALTLSAAVAIGVAGVSGYATGTIRAIRR